METVREMDDQYRFPDLPINRGDHSFNVFLPPYYLIGETLGEGEFASVKLAYHLRDGRYVAIKCFKSRSGQMKMLDEQILREVMSTKGLTEHSDHIVRFYEAIFYGNKVFYVMEYCPYGDLRCFINRGGPLSDGHAREFFAHICRGVQTIHAVNIVHRDLKLENLLVDSKFRIKIADFGCARRQIDKTLCTIRGSYAYGAPELVRGDNYDGKKCDVWSMGIILFAMVTGRLPYSDKGSLKRLLSERKKEPSFPLSVRVTESCRHLICQMLTYNPEERLSLEEVIEHPWVSYKECKEE